MGTSIIRQSRREKRLQKYISDPSKLTFSEKIWVHNEILLGAIYTAALTIPSFIFPWTKSGPQEPVWPVFFILGLIGCISHMIVILIGRSTDRLFKWNYRKERAILTRGIRKGGNRLTAIPNGDYVDIFELTRSISWKDPDHTYPDTSYVLQLWPLSLKGSAHKKKIGSFHAEDEFDKAIEKWNSQQEQLAIETEPHHSYEAVGLAKSLNNNRR